MSFRNGKAGAEASWAESSKMSKYAKKLKARGERRRAKTDPESPPGYKKHRGYVS